MKSQHWLFASFILSLFTYGTYGRFRVASPNDVWLLHNWPLFHSCSFVSCIKETTGPSIQITAEGLYWLSIERSNYFLHGWKYFNISCTFLYSTLVYWNNCLTFWIERVNFRDPCQTFIVCVPTLQIYPHMVIIVSSIGSEGKSKIWVVTEIRGDGKPVLVTIV